MKELADNVWQLSGFPPNAINVYLIDDVVVDAATKRDAGRIVKQLKGHSVTAHALTHAHADHQGASAAICDRLGIPFWVGAGDVAAAEDPKVILAEMPDHPMPKLMFKLFAGPGRPVDRPLSEGDQVGSFTVLEVPGHSRGHVAFWRESDRTLVAGDVLNSMHVWTMIPGLRLPPNYFTPDPELNRASAKRLGELEPNLVLLGHGPPVTDAKKFADFCRGL